MQVLNEVQAYVLLRRYVQEQDERPEDVLLDASWLPQLTAYYGAERSRLLRCIEAVLSTGDELWLPLGPVQCAKSHG